MKSTLKRDIKLKDGRQFLKGEKVNITFIDDTYISVLANSGTFKTRSIKGHRTFTGFCQEPSLLTLTKWEGEGIARTVTGDRCELDGYGEENSPSWFLVLGYI